MSAIVDRKRNLSVPEKDLRSALVAIENVIVQKQHSIRKGLIPQKKVSASDKKNNSTIFSSNERVETHGQKTLEESVIEAHNKQVLIDALGELKQSLTTNLKRFVNPVTQEEYAKMLRKNINQYDTNGPEDSEQKSYSYLDLLDIDSKAFNESDQSSSDESSYNFDDLTFSSFQDDSDDEDDDEEMYIDKEAQSRAKELRAKLHEETNRLLKLQTEVPQIAKDLMNKEIYLFRKQINASIEKFNVVDQTGNLSKKLIEKDGNDKEDNKIIEINLNVENADIDGKNVLAGQHETNFNNENVIKMQNSLQRLTHTLISIEKSIPDCLDGLRETINTVEESIEKKILSNKDISAMPKVEQAILSRNGSEIQRKKSIRGEKDTKNGFVPPKKRLAMFLSR